MPLSVRSRQLSLSLSLSRGFTLMELMIVIAIIGILAGSLFPAYTQYLERTRRSRAMTDIRNLQKVVAQLVVDTGKTPFGCIPNVWDNHEGWLSDPQSGILVRPTFFGQPPFSNCPGWSPEDPWAGPYIQDLPLDPWKNGYYFDGDYTVCIDGNDLTPITAIVSYGPNKIQNYPNCAAQGITDDIYIKMEL